MASKNEAQVRRLEVLLGQYDGLDHIWIRPWGKSLVLCSGDKDDRWDRARFTELGRDVWMLSFPKRTSGWEKTPFVGPLDEVADTLISNFGWHLDPL